MSAAPDNHRRRPLHEAERCWNGSGYKSSFRSVAKARQAIKRHKHSHPALYVYQCERCGLFHITSKLRGGDST